MSVSGYSEHPINAVFLEKRDKNISTNQYFNENFSQLAQTLFTLVNTAWENTPCKHKVLLAKVAV